MGVPWSSTSGVVVLKSSGMLISMARTGGSGLVMVGRGVRCNLSIALFLLSDVVRSSSICVCRFVGEDVRSFKVLHCLRAWYDSS